MKSKTCQRIGKIIYEQGHNDGYEEGIDLKQEDEYAKGYNDGYNRGEKDAGFEKTWNDAYKKGREDMKKDLGYI